MKTMPSVAHIRKPPAPEPVLLVTGDRMDQPTFHRLYSQTAKSFRAELIEGVVQLASPVSFHHSGPLFNLVTWLGIYVSRTPGIRGFSDATLKIDDQNEYQPNGMLLILPETGGQIRVDDSGNYWSGVPELVLEVSYSTTTIDRVQKRRVYEEYGVREYVNVLVETQQVEWWTRRKSLFVATRPDRDGCFKSKTFPGLWLDSAAVFDPTAARLLTTLDAGLTSPEHARFVAKLQSRRSR